MMRGQMIPYLVFARLHSREEVHVLPIDSDPEKRVQVMRLSKPSGMDREIAAMFAHVQTLKRPDEASEPRQRKTQREPEITTNIAGALAYTKRLSQTFQTERQRVAASGKPLPPATRFVANIFTDGKPEGPQTKLPPGPWPAEVTVWFWGVESIHETSLKKWATADMGLPENQFHIVRFSDWQSIADKVYGPQVGRPNARVEVLKRLGLGDTVARIAGVK